MWVLVGYDDTKAARVTAWICVKKTIRRETDTAHGMPLAGSYCVQGKVASHAGSRTRKSTATSWSSVSEAGTKKGIRRQRTWTKAVIDNCLLCSRTGNHKQHTLKLCVADTIKSSLLLLALVRRCYAMVQLPAMRSRRSSRASANKAQLERSGAQRQGKAASNAESCSLP